MFSELVDRNFALVQQTVKRLAEIYQSELTKLLPAEGILRVQYNEELDKYRLFHAVSEFLAKISEAVYPGTTVLFLDDLHWADRPTCELLDFLVRSVKQSAKIFGTYRVEEIKDSPLSDYWGIWARERLYTQITLSPLSEEQSRQLGGNPFFIEEIMGEFYRRKKIYWDGQDWIFAKSIEVSIPATIKETIQRKLKLLDPETRTCLQIAAVFGQEFSPEIIAIATKRNVGQVMEALDTLTRLGCIKPRTDETYFFSEDVVREIVYRDISRANLVHYHKAVGEAIETVFHSVITNYHAQLAHHFAARQLCA